MFESSPSFPLIVWHDIHPEHPVPLNFIKHTLWLTDHASIRVSGVDLCVCVCVWVFQLCSPEVQMKLLSSGETCLPHYQQGTFYFHYLTLRLSSFIYEITPCGCLCQYPCVYCMCALIGAKQGTLCILSDYYMCGHARVCSSKTKWKRMQYFRPCF